MARTAMTPTDARTYLPDGSHEAEILDFVAALERNSGRAAHQRPAIVGGDGLRTEIPDSMVEILRQVAHALGQGMGVNVAPLNAILTTQEAADFLGISRPTMVRMLERGDLPMEKPGRHRFVRLSDLIDYQQRGRAQRRRILEQMQRQGEVDGLYAATDGVVHRRVDSMTFPE